MHRTIICHFLQMCASLPVRCLIIAGIEIERQITLLSAQNIHTNKWAATTMQARMSRSTVTVCIVHTSENGHVNYSFN
jgi:hypothetical protein